MAKLKDFGHKVAETEYCSGYIDVHGHWNNGFLCPRLDDGGKIQYCCGSENHKYCCVQKVQEQEPESTYMYQRLPLVTGLMVTLILLLLVATVLCCYFCKYCALYKRRKRNRQDYVMYDGDNVSQANEFVVIPGQTHYPGALVPNGYNTLNQNLTKTDKKDAANISQLDNEQAPDGQNYDHTVDASTCIDIPGEGHIFRNPVALANDRDSGYYPSVLDCDSMTCLTENLTLKRARERQMSHNDPSSRHSWSTGDNRRVLANGNIVPQRHSEDREVVPKKKDDEGQILLEERQTSV